MAVREYTVRLVLVTEGGRKPSLADIKELLHEELCLDIHGEASGPCNLRMTGIELDIDSLQPLAPHTRRSKQ